MKWTIKIPWSCLRLAVLNYWFIFVYMLILYCLDARILPNRNR